jgi:cytochrome b
MRMRTDKKIPIWDVPTRLFHWLLLSSVFIAWCASRREWLLDVHVAAGTFCFALVAFRVVWGVAGGTYSRFSVFVRGPGAIAGYLAGLIRGETDHYLGHNPAAGAMVVALLSTIAMLAVTGAVAYGGEERLGIAAGLTGFETGLLAHSVHVVLYYAAAVLVAMHVFAVIVHTVFLKDNVVIAMITGKRRLGSAGQSAPVDLPGQQGAAPDSPGGTGQTLGRAAAVAAAAIIAFYSVYTFASTTRGVYPPAEVVVEGGSIVPVPGSPLYTEECASCHNAFHPTLLPERSWAGVMGGLEDHFGDDASIDPDTAAVILEYLGDYSAQRSVTEASRRILSSLAPGEYPISVTATGYWKRKHSGIPGDVYGRAEVRSRANCVACHPGAEPGSFEDRDIRNMRR